MIDIEKGIGKGLAVVLCLWVVATWVFLLRTVALRIF